MIRQEACVSGVITCLDAGGTIDDGQQLRLRRIICVVQGGAERITIGGGDLDFGFDMHDDSENGDICIVESKAGTHKLC